MSRTDSLREKPALLHSIGTSVPSHRLSQEEIKEFMISTAKADQQGDNMDQTVSFIRSIYENSEIQHRNSVIPDFAASGPAGHSFFPASADLEPLPTTGERMSRYEREAPELAETAARRALNQANMDPEQVTHLVFTSCTGHFAPGPGTQLIQRLGLPSTVRRVLIGFMGCYAGFNTLRTSAEIVRGQPEARVLQICLELCTLHFQKDFTKNGIVSDSLFADGCAAAVVTGPSGPPDHFPLALLGPSHCQVDTDHETKMTWRIGNEGFRMYLDPEVPERLKPHIESFVSTLKNRSNGFGSDIQQWAIHPGGSKILRAVADVLHLSPGRIRPSRNVLQKHGNMSSPTILFILKRVLQDEPLERETCALGFGPGLSLEGMILSPPSHR